MQHTLSHSLKIACILFATSMVTGCVTTDNIPPFEGPPREYSIKMDSSYYTVHFADGKSDISKDEKAAIQKFLAGFSANQGESLAVSFNPTGDNSDLSKLAADRSRAVANALRDMGFKPDISGTPPHLGDQDVAITRSTPKLVMPQCPDWSKPPGGDSTNSVFSNFNCANATNLGMMVANPMDLVQPNSISPQDGAGSVLSIQRYRADKVRELSKETATKKEN